jgi:transketolase
MTTPSRRDLANAIRFLAIDAVQAANSGHPGMPMGMADIAEVLWNDVLKHNPANPRWADRDRFILSNGHGSMLQYALLHLSGYDLSIDDLKQLPPAGFEDPGPSRELHDLRHRDHHRPAGPGPGECGGLRAGGKTAGAALQPRRPRHRRPPHLGVHGRRLPDGRHLARSRVACRHLGLGKLVAFWDDNHISIDGNTDGWFTDDTPKRFEAYGWNVVRGVDGHDPVEIRTAIETAMKSSDKPTLICCRTTIGFGSPNKAGKESVARLAAGQGRSGRHPRSAGLDARCVRDPAGCVQRLARARPRRGRGRLGRALRCLCRGIPG